ncbi:class I SAM-dependent methyltransferase [Mycobacterium kubicae]|uniref:Methyltransferase domain-containing protein n=1 Tax=Mycobacterium kubicae TaxID=120959 RepID=A0AAX1JBZ2_9MYCO|nr:class I SAM-dependent methyltransferase [Mycobacterium kubicae]MCV7094834.1 methyltransferase domain-containing protein [Mycobacterium kubicae]OBK53931.1 methyltransferase type 11 [Mycobacterium kubicae]ORV99928.1 methyltransferase type 11 [Mycobacterium kubicae]QNI14427.1 methyltransferase domain-containing protein [Mycobacterium kubicae]QPI37950.1 methyltransferase domain-containing protein [Mycobacterium kubicae]
MAMNLLHRMRCSSAGWEKAVADQLLPWALSGVDLGRETLEIGPGYGATLRALLERPTSLTAVEVDGSMAARLTRRYGDRARVIHGDGTETGLPSDHFTSVVCFTMLHHIPTAVLQDRLFAEAFRVLQPGGAFAGSDGVPSLPFRLIHIADTYNPIAPDELPGRLGAAGFTDIRVDVAGGRQRWRASKPIAA